MYRPPINPGTLRVEARHHAPEAEHDVLRRQHREHVAAERARLREERDAHRVEGRRIAHPLASLRALILHRGI